MGYFTIINALPDMLIRKHGPVGLPLCSAYSLLEYAAVKRYWHFVGSGIAVWLYWRITVIYDQITGDAWWAKASVCAARAPTGGSYDNADWYPVAYESFYVLRNTEGSVTLTQDTNHPAVVKALTAIKALSALEK